MITALEAARVELEQSHADRTAAADALSRAEAAFGANPTSEAADAVLDAKRAVEKAALFVEARAKAEREAAAAAEAASVVDARVKHAQLLGARQGILQKLGSALQRMAVLYEAGEQLIQEISGIAEADAVLHGRIAHEAARARISEAQPDPIQLDEVRLALGLLLGQRYPAPQITEPLGSLPLGAFNHALARIPAAETHDKMRRLLAAASSTFASAVGATVGDWFTLAESPRSTDHGPHYDDVRRAETLLADLEVDDG